MDGLPNQAVEELLEGQAAIGWRQFFKGWLSREWKKAQQAYYTSMKSLWTSGRWTVTLIKKLWDIAWELWEHQNGILHEAHNVVSDVELQLLDRNMGGVDQALSTSPASP